VGAPFIEPEAWAEALRAERLPGVHFRPCVFQPRFHKWKGQECGGVQLHVTDQSRFKPYLTGLALIATARRLYPGEFAWRKPPYEFEKISLPIDLLCGTDRVRRQIEARVPLRQIEASWQDQLAAFKAARRKFLLYR
jgi:uncharacterized protein YbbC (DUF1343 family)